MYKKYFTLITGLLVLWCAVFMMPADGACAGASVKVMPIAQAYEVRGDVAVKRSSDENKSAVKAGVLLGSDDLLTLEDGAEVGLYFKDGGKKSLKAKEGLLTCKVGDLLPKPEAYEKTIATFGTTRDIDLANMGVGVQTLFYPQETLIVDSQPAIELAIFDGSDVSLGIDSAMVQVSEEKRVVHSENLDDLVLGVPYAYSCGKLSSGKEYTTQVRLGIAGLPDEAITFSFNFFVAQKPDAGSISACAPFSDKVYRSLESTSAEYKGKTYKFWFIKSLQLRDGMTQPVISAEIIVK